MKCFPDKIKLKEFIITNPLLYEVLKGLIKEKDCLLYTSDAADEQYIV